MKASTLRTAVVIAASVAVYFTPPPAGARVVLVVDRWALGVVPEHITGLIFFALAYLRWRLIGYFG